MFEKITRLFAKPQVAEYPFRHRVADFWREFAAQEAELRRQNRQDNDPEHLTSAIKDMIDKYLFEAGVEVCSDPQKDQYELTVTYYGDPVMGLYSYYWWRAAPEELKRHWTFYPAIQPWEPGAMPKFDMGTLSPESLLFRLTPSPDTASVDIEICGTDRQTVAEKSAALGVFLNHTLGEMTMVNHVGNIKITDQKPADAIPAKELKKAFDELMKRQKWSYQTDPLSVWGSYGREPTGDTRRSEIDCGATNHYGLINALNSNEAGNILSDAAQAGIVYGYLFYRRPDADPTKMLEERTKILDAIKAECLAQKIAWSIGSATGKQYLYLDWIIFDRAAFLEVVRKILPQYKVKEAGFCDFAQPLQVILIK